MSSKQPLLRRLAAGAGVLSLAVLGLATMSSPAFAAVGPDQPGAPTAGTLTVNKYSGAPVAPGQSPDPANLLSGVKFKVTQVGKLAGAVCTPIDLSDAAQWAGLEGLFNSAPAAPTAPFCLTNVVQEEPTVAGQRVFNLSVGIYFVQETDPGPNPIVSPVPDFYVSIPTSLGDTGNGWNYNVVADPKNQLMKTPVKTIEDRPDALVVGSDLTWDLTVPIPTLNNQELFTEAIVSDTLDPRLAYVVGSSTVMAGATPLTDGTHYNVTGNAVWTFTAAGLTALNANMGADLTIEFDTTVNSVGDGTIPNNTYSSKFNGTTVPGETVPYSYWGELTVFKHDDSAPQVLPLEGAEFKVFEKPAAADCPATVPATGVVATGTSNASGVVQWAGVAPTNPLGLWVANSPDGPLTNPSKFYCVYETVVPAGHTAATTPHLVKIEPGTAKVFDLKVKNTKKDGPDLPLTGAQGTMALTIGGMLIIAAGAGLLVASRRRRGHDQLS